jgi:KpsF/GutQ family protein
MLSPSKINGDLKRTVWESALLVWNAEADSLRLLQKSIDPQALSHCVEAIADCKGRVLTAGCGTSAAAARKIAHSLCCVGRPATFLAPGDALHGGLGLAQPTDLAILISKGGNTTEIVGLIPPLQAKQVPIIGVTENPDSVLGKAADVLLRVKVKREPDEFNMLATASTMAVIAVFDAICITLMKVTGFTRRQFAIIHPGGAVGGRLEAGLRRVKGRETT